MTLVERIRKILIAKEAIIDRYYGLLGDWTKGMEKRLVSAVDDALSSLDVVNGVIQNTQVNMERIAVIERALKEVNEELYPRLAHLIENGTYALNLENEAYFRAIYSGSRVRLDVALVRAGELLRSKIGITETGRLIRNGWMASVVEDTTILRGIKDILLKSVIAGTSMRDVRRTLTDFIIGNEERAGIFARYMKQTVYDVFQQHDSAYSATVADELGFNYFLYSGGLIETSRDFCMEHDGHVYHRDDAKEWSEWTPSKAIHITEFKQKDIYAVPSYLGYSGYEPLIDRGGYNCRHFLSWIADDVAERLIEENNKLLQEDGD